MQLIKAVLVKSISYKKDGKTVYVALGSDIIVDLNCSVALIGDALCAKSDHVSVTPDEYEIDQ